MERKTSVFNFCAFADEADSAISGQINALRENGYTLLEIRGVDGKNISEVSLSEAALLHECLDNSGICVWAIGSPTGKIDIKNDFSSHFDDFKRMLEISVVLRASHYRLFSFYCVRSDAERDTVLERLDNMLTEAKGSGVILCHENEKGIYGEKKEACLDIHRSLPELKAVFDPANFIQAGENTSEAWKLLEPYVEYIHIKDALADGTVVPAGHGIGNVLEIIKSFGKRGGGTLSVEPHLSLFNGLKDLEDSHKSEINKYLYPNQQSAFKAAVEALNVLIDRV